jgi:hypothetical protein
VRPRSPRGTRIQEALALAAVAFAILPIAVAPLRAIAHHWLPIGDDAFFAIRSRDVLTAHHPLLGTWTSASLTMGKDLNNPGPLQFDLLALPAKISGAGGLAIGTALVNIAAVLGIALTARRLGGPLLVAASMAGAAGLAWTMGSELLYDPWQPHALLLPFLFLLVLAWAVLAGRWRALPIAAGVASLIVQTHLSYAVLVGAVALAMAGALVVARRGSADGGRPWRAVATAVVVAAVCWSQPLVEQLQHGGDGNLAVLASTGGGGGTPLGARLGVRLVASVLALPPFWARPSFREDFVLVGLARLPALGPAAASLGLLAAVLVAALVVSGRARDRVALAGLLVAAVAAVAAVMTAIVLPRSRFGAGIAPHQLRWVWPVAVFVTVAIAVAAARRVDAVAATAAFAAVAVALGAWAIPTFRAEAGPSADAYAIPPARHLVAGLGGLDRRGPYLFDVSGLRFAEPYSTTVMAELQRRGIEFVVDDSGMVHQLGPSRRRTGRVAGRLFLREADAAFEPQPGARLVSRVSGLTAPQHDELVRLQGDVRAAVAREGLRLNHRGRDATKVKELATFAAARGAAVHDADTIVYSGELTLAVREHLLVFPDAATRRLLERYVSLQERWSKQTVALFVGSAA